MIFLTSFILNNVRMLLISGIGTPYDPKSGRGVIGRNYAYQCNTGATYFFEDKTFNPFMGSGANGMVFDDFNGDNFDHSGLGFIGGADINVNPTGGRPIQNHPTPPGTPAWGAGWKQAVAKWYSHAFSSNAQGGVQAYRQNYLDLDPTYRDAFGLPLLRVTFDWGPHELKQSAYMADVQTKLGKALGAAQMAVKPQKGHYTTQVYQSTHNTGGAIMGADPTTSAVNKYLQSWDVSNLFVVGANAFPQNAGYNPTGTVCALAYHTADAVLKRYVKHPGPLAG